MIVRFSLVFAAIMTVASFALQPKDALADAQSLTFMAQRLVADRGYLPDPIA